MANNNEKTEENLETGKLTPQEEQEAYFLLVQIFSNAQATQNQAQFEHDLAEWKKRYKLDFFSDEYKRKIKYMLSKEFLDTIIKNFSIYQEQAQMDYSKGLEKLHKILDRAKKHKNESQLDKDLDSFFKIYSKDIFKKTYPHIIANLLSKAYRTKILEKFDSALAYNDLKNIIEHPENYKDADDYKSAIEAWHSLYPTADFNDKYRGEVEKALTTALDAKKLEQLFSSSDIDLTDSEGLSLDIDPFAGKTRSQFFENARKEFFDIVNVNIGDTDRTFAWIYKYGRYINEFDTDTKNAIVSNLMKKYHNEFSSSKTNYRIPEMNSGADELLTLSDFETIDDTKKQVVLQLLGILYNGLELTDDDIRRLNIIHSNVQKARIIEETHISDKLDYFMEKYPEDELTPSVLITLESNSASSLDVSISDNIDLEISTNENGNIVVEEAQIHSVETNSFKTALKVTESLERISSSSNNAGSSDSGNNVGGSSISIATKEPEAIDEKEENEKEENEKEDKNVPETQVSSSPITTSSINYDIPDTQPTENHELEVAIDTSIEATDIKENTTDIIETSETIATIVPETSETVNTLPEPDNTSSMSLTQENISESLPADEDSSINTETHKLDNNIEPSNNIKDAHQNVFQNFFHNLLGRKNDAPSKSGSDDDRDDR